MSCSPASDILGTQEEESFCGPVGDVMAALDGARAMVRELFETVVDAGAEQRVGPGDLAAVVDSAARLERAVSAVGVASIAGYARREDPDDPGESSRGWRPSGPAVSSTSGRPRRSVTSSECPPGRPTRG